MGKIATRRERVILDLTDNLSGGLAKAAVASRLLKSELNDLGRDSTKVGRALDGVGESSTRATRDIDKFSGRLRLLVDTAILLGPALAPLGAGLVPVVSGLAMALGTTALAGGTAVLAFNGLGDALGSLNDYQLEPTAENLAKVEQEMAKIGPSGEHFVRFLDGLEPALKDVQMAARDGLLPGVEDGITALLGDLPAIRDFVGELAGVMGDLAASGGEALSGDRFRAFFEYLRTDAAPTLEQMGRTIGLFSEGFANLVVGLAPATRDFGNGLEDMARGFAEWSRGLEDNESFQEFLAYVREAGPQAAEFAGQLIRAGAAIAQAMAPIGSVVLPALTNLLSVIADIASSPIGGVFVAAAVGITAYSRAVAIATAASAKMTAASDRMAASADRSGTSLGRIGRASAGIAITATVVGALADNIGRINAEDLDRNLEALSRGEVVDDMDKLVHGLWEMTSAWNAVDLGEIATLGGLAGDSTLDKYAENVEQVDQALANLVETGDEVKARALFSEISRLAEEQGVSVEDVATAFDSYALAVENAKAAGGPSMFDGFLSGAHGAVDGLIDLVGGIDEVTEATGRYERSVNHLNGVLDRRDALRGYKDAIRDFNQALKKGEAGPREMEAALDNIARSAVNMSETLVGADKRRFLKQARADFVDAAAKMLGSEDAAERLARKLFDLNEVKANPKVDIDLGPLRAGIAQANAWLNDIPDEHVLIHMDRVGGMGGPGRDRVPGGNEPPQRTTAPRTSRSVVPTSLTFGRGSSMGDDKAAMYGGMFAAKDAFQGLYEGANAAAGGLKGLKRELAAAERAVARETRQRDRLQAQRDAVSGAISGDLSNDLFAVSEASGNPWAAGATAGGTMDPLAAAQARRDRAQRYIAAIRTLKGMGLDKGALSAIISEGLEAAEFMAAQPSAYVSEFASTLAEANQFVAQASNMGANAIVSVAEMNAAITEWKEANQHLKDIEKAIDKLEKSNKDGHKNTQHAASNQGQSFASALDKTARDGRRRANR